MIAPELKDKAGEFVIPRWLDYAMAVDSGELSLGGDIFIPSSPTFEQDFHQFEANPTDGLTTDLLGKAFLENRPEKTQLAEAVLRSKNIAAPTLRMARRIISTSNQDGENYRAVSLAKQIANLRSHLRERPKNPIRWVDLARIYTAAGQDEKAFDSMRIALALAPEDRFTIRAFARLCIHTESASDAIKLFSKNRNLLKDPWLMATAESLSKIADKPSPLPKSVSLSSNQDCEKFQHSELFEAFAMAEWMHGKERLAKRAFRAAWEKPSQNVIRHAEWFTRRTLPSLRSETETKFGESHEAAARAALKDGGISEALRRCELWRFEEPYSVHPLAFESYLLCVSEQFEQVAMCFQKAKDRRLMSAMLFFNYLFATLMQGDSKLGEDILCANESKMKGDVEYLLLANQGLLELTKGVPSRARECYLQAEILAGDRNAELKDRVFLHYCRGFLKFGFSLADGEDKRIAEIKNRRSDTEIQILIFNIEKALKILAATESKASALKLNSR